MCILCIIYAPIPLHSVSAGSSTNLKDCEVHYLSGSKHEKAQKTQDHMNITHFSVNDHLDFKVSAQIWLSKVLAIGNEPNKEGNHRPNDSHQRGSTNMMEIWVNSTKNHSLTNPICQIKIPQYCEIKLLNVTLERLILLKPGIPKWNYLTSLLGFHPILVLRIEMPENLAAFLILPL